MLDWLSQKRDALPECCVSDYRLWVIFDNVESDYFLYDLLFHAIQYWYYFAGYSGAVKGYKLDLNLMFSVFCVW